MKKSITVLLVWALAFSPGAFGEGIPCWTRCHRPPAIYTTADLSSALRKRPNKELNFLARSTGILTTYLFKIMGIQGWKDYHREVYVRGSVVQAIGSDDGLYTVDISIEQLNLDGAAVDLHDSRFLRAEIFPNIRIGAPLPLEKNDYICMPGKLMWDGDGFLEIHPKHAHQIHVGPGCR